MEVSQLEQTAHLKAAAIDILLDDLRPDSRPVRHIVVLLQAFWFQASARTIIEDVIELFPADCRVRVQAFCAHNYPHWLHLFSSQKPEWAYSCITFSMA